MNQIEEKRNVFLQRFNRKFDRFIQRFGFFDDLEMNLQFFSRIDKLNKKREKKETRHRKRDDKSNNDHSDEEIPTDEKINVVLTRLDERKHLENLETLTKLIETNKLGLVNIRDDINDFKNKFNEIGKMNNLALEAGKKIIELMKQDLDSNETAKQNKGSQSLINVSDGSIDSILKPAHHTNQEIETLLSEFSSQTIPNAILEIRSIKRSYQVMVDRLRICKCKDDPLSDEEPVYSDFDSD